MEIDLGQLTESREKGPVLLRGEVCIVGAGIAGLLLAGRLTRAGVQVVLLEAGGQDVLPEALAERAYVEALGGSSRTWGGQLLPAAELGGWPVQPQELMPYAAAVEQVLGVDALPYAAPEFLAALGENERGFPSGGSLCVRMSKFVPFRRRNLAATLGRVLLRDSHVQVALQARVLEVTWDRGTGRARGVRGLLRSGRSFQVQAQHVVVAAGTVASCGLLLRSGVPSPPECLGRNLHDHLTLQAAEFTGDARAQVIRRFRPWLPLGLAGTMHSIKLESSSASRAQLGDRVGMAHFTFAEPSGAGLGGLREMLRERQLGQGVAAGALRTLTAGAGDLLRLLREAAVERRRYVPTASRVGLQLNLAQKPQTGCRVQMEEDGQGGWRVVAPWQPEAADLDALRRFAVMVEAELRPAGLGRGREARWNEGLFAPKGELAGLEDARHRMGGAVMGTDPGCSVVDPQLGVHGMTHLHVASAAVFPDGSPQLPTLTLMALTLRLGDRLLDLLGKGR